MKKDALITIQTTSKDLRDLFKLYANSGLNADSSYKEFAKVAEGFLKKLDKDSRESLLTQEFDVSIDSFEFPKNFSIWDKHDFTYGFEALLFAAKNYINKHLSDFIDLKTERQASPPSSVYEMVGHNADINVKKMNYNYLYD